MSKKKKIKLDKRVKKMANNSSYARNVLKSMGFTSIDLVKDLMPNTTEFINSNSDSMSIIKDIRSNIVNRKTMGTQFKTIPQLREVENAFKNIKEDLKSGNFNNKTRENENPFDDDMDFGFGDMFGDDDSGVEFLDDEPSSMSNPPTIIDTMPLAKMIGNSTEATVNTMIAVADQQMAIETEKILFNSKYSNSMLEGLTAMNDNLAMLVKFNAESTTQYHAASMKFYEDSIEIMKKSMISTKDDDFDYSSINDIFNSNGNVRISDYIAHIKKKSKDKKDESMWGLYLDMFSNPMFYQSLVKNPIGAITRLVAPGLVSSGIKNSLSKLDESVNNILPTILTKINTLESSDNVLLNGLYEIFGVKEKLEYDINLDKYERGAISWDGESKKALVEVIPTYLRRIESVLTGEKERAFDYEKGNFVNMDEFEKRYNEKLREKEVSGYYGTKYKLQDMLYSMGANYNVIEDFNENLDKYFSKITETGEMISPFLTKDKEGNVIDGLEKLNLFNGDKDKIKLFRKLFAGLSKKDLNNMFLMEMNDSRKEVMRYHEENSKDPIGSGLNYLYNGSYFDEDNLSKVKYNQKDGGVFNPKDKFGLSQLDYLRDIRKALIHGIKVFPDNRIDTDNNWNPNIDLLSKEDLEREYINRDESVKQTEVTDRSNIERGYSELLNMSQDKFQEAYDYAYERNKKNKKEFKNPFLKFGKSISDTAGGMFSAVVDPISGKIDDKLFKFLYGDKIEDEEITSDGKTVKENLKDLSDKFITDFNEFKNVLFGNKYANNKVSGKSFTGEDYTYEIQDYSNQPTIKSRMKKGVGVLGALASDFADGFHQFKVSLFGEDFLKGPKESMRSLTEKVKERLPKAAKDGLKSALFKTIFASKLGALGSILLPGGPLGAAVIGMTTSLLSQSETFQRWMFGEMDEDGNRSGGVMPDSLVSLYKENKDVIKKGAGAGLLASLFLPGGPVLGAITGIGAGLLAKSDGFQQFIFGDNYQDKENRSIFDGAFGNLFRKLSKDGDPKLATFLGGVGLAAGIGQGVGLLPAMLLPGGPIIGSILGLSAGIAASSDKFQRFLFGEKDEEGKRSGGLLGKFSNWIDVNVGERFKVKLAESNDKIYEFLHRKILFPIEDALAPIKQMGLNVLDSIKESFHNVTDPVVESFKDYVTRPLGEWLRKKIMDPITKKIKGMFSLLGKALGWVVSSPIKLLTGIGKMADYFNERGVLREEKRKRRENLKENIKENGFSGLIKGIKGLRITKDEKEQLLTTGKMQYRADRAKNQEEREDELQSKLDERKSKTAELQQQFEEDLKNASGSGWTKGSKRKQEKEAEMLKKKQQWLQEQNLLETAETNKKLEFINTLLENGNVKGDEAIATLKDIKKTLVDQLKDLGNKFSKGSDTTDSIGEKIRDGLNDLGQSHEDGLDNVPYDGYVAELHKGEMIIPKEQSNVIRQELTEKRDNQLIKWLSRKEDQEKDDRDDNALGLTDEEVKQRKEFIDLERYGNVSKQGVDYIMEKREKEQKEKEEKQWKTNLYGAVTTIAANTAGIGAAGFDLFGELGDLIKSFTDGSFFDKLKTGLLAVLGVTGLTAFGKYAQIAEENNVSIWDVVSGDYREERKDVDGEYIYDNQGGQIVRRGGKVLLNTGRKVVKKGSRIYNKAKDTVDRVKNTYTNTKNSIYKMMGKNTVDVADDVVENATTYTDNAIKNINPKLLTGASDNVIEATVLESSDGVIRATSDDVVEASTKRAGKYMDEFIKMSKKVISTISDYAVKKFPGMKSIANFADDIFKKILANSDSIFKRFGKKILQFFTNSAGDSFPPITVITGAYDILSGFYSGNAANLFGVPKNHVDFEMKAITSFMQLIGGLSFFSLVWLLNEITTSLMNWDFMKGIATAIYNALPINAGKKVDLSNDLKGLEVDSMSTDDLIKAAGGDPNKFKDVDLQKLSLKELQKLDPNISTAELMEIQRVDYNQKNGTQLNAAAWKDKVSQTFGSKVMDMFSTTKAEREAKVEEYQAKLDSGEGNWFTDKWNQMWLNRHQNKLNEEQAKEGEEKTWKDKLNTFTQAVVNPLGFTSEMLINGTASFMSPENAEKFKKGLDKTKWLRNPLGAGIDWLFGKNKKNQDQHVGTDGEVMTGDAGMGEGFDPEEEKIVPIYDNNGTLMYYTTKVIDDVSEIEGLTEKDLSIPKVDKNTQIIPQMDQKGNIISYTTVDNRKKQGIFSRIGSAISSLFGSSNTTNSNVSNSNSITNNTGDTYNTTTNEIDTTPFKPLTDAINSLVAINTGDNVDENGDVKDGGILNVILDPMGYLGRKLMGYGVNIYESTSGNELDDTKLNDTITFLTILRNPLGYLYNTMKNGGIDFGGENPDNPNGNPDDPDIIQKWFGKCKKCGKKYKDCTCAHGGSVVLEDGTCRKCGKPMEQCKCDHRNLWDKTKDWGKDKWEATKNWGKEKIDAGKEWVDEKLDRSQETAAIMTGNKDAKASLFSTAVDTSSSIATGIWNLFASEENELTSGEMADAAATFINKAFVTPFKMLTDPAVEKFNETKEAISTWVTEKKDAIVGWWKENIAEPWDKNKEKAKETQQAIFDDVKSRKDAITNWFNEKLKKPWDEAKERAKQTQQAIFDDVKARKDAITDWFNKKIAEPFKDVKNKMKESVTGWVKGLKDKIVNTFNTYIKDPVSDALSPVTSAISGAWNSFKSAFTPFVDIFDYLSGKSEKSLAQIIKDFGSSGRTNLEVSNSDEIPTDNGAGRTGVNGRSIFKPKKHVMSDTDYMSTTTNNNTTNNNNSNTNNKFVFYSQSDSRWGRTKMGNSNLKDSGCGPTSLAMAISQLTGQHITPDTIAELGKEHLPGYAQFSLFPSIADKFNMGYNEGTDANFIYNNLNKGLPVILSGRTGINGTPYTNEGHVVTATHMRGKDVFIQDPRGKEYSGYYPMSKLMLGLNKGMVISPNKTTSLEQYGADGIQDWNSDYYNDLYKNPILTGDVGEYNQYNNLGKTGAEQVTVADRVLSYARAFLNNTSKFSYSQPRRLQIDNNKGNGADCSSFVSHVLSRAGDVNIYGNTSTTLWENIGTKVDDPQIGDVVCQVGHVGLYSGDGNYIHMSGRKHGIRESKAIQNGNNKHRGYKRVLQNPSQLVDPTVPNPNSLLGTVVATKSGHPVGGGGGNVSTTPGTTTTSESAVDTLGVFSQMANIGNNMIASIFNGKDMFDTQTSTTPTDGTNPDISNISDNAEAVWKFFTGKGYTPEATAGILGNMTQESGVVDVCVSNISFPLNIEAIILLPILAI